VTTALDVNVTLQSAVPVHPAPLQPVKVNPGAALARKDTVLPETKLEEQVDPQLIPEGVLVAIPFPFFATLSVTSFMAKLAVQVLFASILTEPSEQSECPVQPVNFEFDAGRAVKVTTVPDV
jgi:hypothetical protein